jgi:hypothetical protein
MLRYIITKSHVKFGDCSRKKLQILSINVYIVSKGPTPAHNTNKQLMLGWLTSLEPYDPEAWYSVLAILVGGIFRRSGSSWRKTRK